MRFPERLSVNRFTGKHAQDSQHGQSSILHFDIQESQLSIGLVIQSDTKVPRTKITGRLVLPGQDKDFVHANDYGYLDPSHEWDNIEGSESVGDLVEFEVATGREVARVRVVFLDEHAEGGGHGDAAVFEFDVAVVTKVSVFSAVWAVFNEIEGTGCDML